MPGRICTLARIVHWCTYTSDRTERVKQLGEYAVSSGHRGLAVMQNLTFSLLTMTDSKRTCSVKSFIRLTQTTILNYSITTRNILIIDASASRRKPSSGLTSGAGHQYVKACSIRGSVGSSPRLIHLLGLLDPYRLPYMSATFVWFSINHLGILPVCHMVLIVLFCSSKDSCDAVHFFSMFFHSCSQWSSCFSDSFKVI